MNVSLTLLFLSLPEQRRCGLRSAVNLLFSRRRQDVRRLFLKKNSAHDE